MPMHFGPLTVTVYADGLTVGGPRACGAPGGDMAEPASLFVYLVDCSECRSTGVFRRAARVFKEAGELFVPAEEQIDSIRWRYSRRGVYRIKANNDFRESLGLAPVYPAPWLLPELKRRMQRRKVDYKYLQVEADLLRAEAARVGADIVTYVSTDVSTGKSTRTHLLVERAPPAVAKSKSAEDNEDP